MRRTYYSLPELTFLLVFIISNERNFSNRQLLELTNCRKSTEQKCHPHYDYASPCIFYRNTLAETFPMLKKNTIRFP